MKKRILSALVAIAMLLVPLGPAVAPLVPTVQAQPNPNATFWYVQLRDERMQPLTASAICFVYTTTTDTLATIYTDATLGTAASNPITGTTLFQSTGNSCAFFTASSVTSVDVIAWTKRGRSRITGLTAAASGAKVLILDQQMTQKIIQIPYSAQAPSTGTSYVNSGVTIPKGFVITDVFVQVTNAGAGNDIHLAAGILERHAGGLIALGNTIVADASYGGMNVSTLGWFHAAVQLTTTGGYPCISGFHTGALLSQGFKPASCNSHAGAFFKTPFVGDGTNKTVVYHVGTSLGFQLSPTQATAAGYFYLLGTELGNDTIN